MKKTKMAMLLVMAMAAAGLTACQGKTSETTAAQTETAAAAGETKTEETTAEETSAPKEGSRMAEILKSGKMVVATSGNYAPYTFVGDDGQLQGIDIDMIKAVGEEMGVEIEFTTGNIAGLLPALNDGKVDVISSAMSMTEERKKQIDFSIPYMKTSHIAVVREADKDKFAKGLEDMSEAKVGVIAGTPAENWLLQQKYKEIANYPGNAEAFLDLKRGNIDMYMTSQTVAADYIKNDKDTKDPLTMTGETQVGVDNGIAIKKDEPDLKAALDKAVQTLIDNGTLDEIGEKYIGMPLPR